MLTFCKEPGLSPATLSQRRTVLIRFSRWARRADVTELSNGHIVDDLLDSPPPPRKRKRPGNWLTLDQLQAAIAACVSDWSSQAQDWIIARRDVLPIVLAGVVACAAALALSVKLHAARHNG